MSNFPSGYDDDSTLPPVNDNIDQIGGDAINALRDAVLAIETTLGLNVAGSQPNLAARLGVFINPDGTPNASIIFQLGLVTLPITNVQIAEAAGIEESKLKLDYRTVDLFNYIRDLAKDVNLAIGWISVSGIKLEPHLIGAIYRHDLEQIDVAETAAQFLNNVFRVLRDNTDAYTLINDINNELLDHQWADGSPSGIIQNIVTNDGSTYPSNYAHVASGIFLNTTGFAVIPQTAINEQLAWDFIDQNSILTLGTRIQNLYANGISVNSRSSSLTTDGYGQPLVPPTPAVAHLRNNGTASTPIDDIAIGDDIIQFFPSPNAGFRFEEQFALVRVGDIVRVNYANDGYFAEVAYVISEKKYIPGSPPTFIVRIAGKNFAYAPNAQARIDRNLFNNNKPGVLAISGVDSTNLPLGTMPSLIVSNPRGAQCLGVSFSPDEFNETHYLLYLALYTTGNPLDGYTILPGIDVTGNQGTTPGDYTLSDIVEATNENFRAPGFNYRFVAFEHEGQFGIMLADSYNNASFSVLSGIVTSGGVFSQPLTQFNFPNNVIDVFPSAQSVTTAGSFSLPTGSIAVASTAGFNSSGTLQVTTSTNGIQSVAYTGISGNTFTGCTGGTGTVPTGSLVTETLVGITAPDPLGFGPFRAGIASPPFMTAYGSFPAANVPTIIFPPLRRNNYYVNGTEQEKLNDYASVGQAEDSFGDGYWVATVETVPPPGAGNQAVTYLITQDLSQSGLKAGKTIVVQPLGTNFGLVDYGRFIISNVNFTCCPPVHTEITVYDAVHAVGHSPSPILAPGSPVAIYFNNDSVSFNNETATDFSVISSQFKRHFEVYVDGNGDTFTHERARFFPSGSSGSSITINAGFGAPLFTNGNFATMDVFAMSPTLRGYQTGNVNKINLNITSFSNTTGLFTGYLNNFDGTNFLSQGPTTTGRIGDVVRFYDQSNIDYIDIIFQITVSPPNFTNQYIDIQLFPTLALDQEVELLGTVEVVGSTVSEFQDLRQFGNTSEEQFTTSALDFIALPEKLLHFNGIVRGFEFINNDGGPTPPTQYGSGAFLSLDGGVALVDGKFSYVNPQTFIVPALVELHSASNFNINFVLCVNSDGDLVTIVLTDPDASASVVQNAPNRIVSVTDLVSSNTYGVDSTTFVDLLNKRKDLTPLYILTSVATGTGASAATTLSNIRDVRRYVNDADSVIPAVLTSSNSQGNFESFAAAINWLSFNNSFQETLYVANSFTIATDPGLTFPLEIIGNSPTAALTFSSAVTMSDVTFKNMTLTFSSNPSFTSATFENCTINLSATAAVNNNVSFIGCTITTTFFDGLNIVQSNDITLQNCTINYNYDATSDGSFSTARLGNPAKAFITGAPGTGGISGLTIDGCVFNTSFANHFPFMSFQFAGSLNFMEQIKITNNAMNTNIVGDDHFAVIMFVAPTSTSISTTGPRLIDCNISNNICNRNQLISISGPPNGLSTVHELLVPINVVIEKNTCGAISYLTKQDLSNDSVTTPNTTSVNDKDHMIIISKNTCRFIYCGTSDGFINITGSTNRVYQGTNTTCGIISGANVYSSAAIIDQNTCSWIQVGVKNPSSMTYLTPMLVISDNQINAYDATFLAPYYATPLSPANIGLIADSIVGGT